MSARWIAIGCLAAACGAAPETARFAGALEGTDARAAAVIEEDAIVLYRCGGATTLDRTRWFRGAIDSDRIAIDGFEGRIDGDRLTGTFEDGSPLDIVRLDDPNAGLYHSTEGACRTGVIAGTTSIQGVSCEEDGRFKQVSPDGPIDRAGFMVQVGLRSLYVVPAHAE